MDPEPKDVIVLSAIEQGIKKFDKIKKKTKIDSGELVGVLERLEQNSMIKVLEKKGFFGPKKEIFLTDKGTKELEERRFELEQNWNHMVSMWKSGDKDQLHQYMNNNKSTLPVMMFMGIMDMMMFTSMMSFMGLGMTSFMPDQYLYDNGSTDFNHDSGGGDYGSGDFGHGDGGPGDMGGFDINF